jgi:CRP-like cAMP-binding protein
MREAVLGLIPHDALRELIRKVPTVAEVLWRDIDAAIFREWLLNVVSEMQPARVAHLFLENFYRLRLINRTRGMSFQLPLTQVDLADAAGVTSIHVIRVLQDLRAQGSKLAIEKPVRRSGEPWSRKTCGEDACFV